MSTKSCFTILWFFLCAIALRCQDDDSIYPINYYKSDIHPAGSLRVFTRHGEIKNQFVINKFILRDTSTYNYWASAIVNYPYLDTIRFSSESKAVVTFSYETIPCSARNTFSTILLTRSDTTRGFTPRNELTHQVRYLICEEKPEVYSEYLHSSTRGSYLFGFAAREKFVLKRDGAYLSAPMLMFITQYMVGENEYYGIGDYINNTLDSDFYLNLEEKDTVSLMEYQLRFEKESH